MNTTAPAFTLAIDRADHLPTVLAALALRLDGFQVSRLPWMTWGHPGWLVQVPSMPQEDAQALLAALPAHMVNVYSVALPSVPC